MEKLAQFDYNLSNKTVLDLNCGIGGILKELADSINQGVGVGSELRNIEAANLSAKKNKQDNIKFYTFDIQKENVSKLWKFLPGDRVDVCLWLGKQSFGINLEENYLANWRNLLRFCVKLSDNALVELNGYPEEQTRSFIEFSKTLYKDVKVQSAESGGDSSEHGIFYLTCSNTPFCFDDVINELARTEDGTSKIKSIEPLSASGWQRDTYRLRGIEKEYFLGVGGERNVTDLVASNFLRKNKVPAIDTILASEDRNGTPYIIRRYVESTTLKDLESKEKVVDEFFNTLCKIHNINLKGYGFISGTPQGDEIKGQWDTWVGFLQFLLVNEGNYLKEYGVIEKKEYNRMTGKYQLYFKKYKEVFDIIGSFLLGDINWSNVLVDCNGKFFLTDFEFALIGDPAFDFSCMFEYQNRHIASYVEKHNNQNFDCLNFRKRIAIYEPIKMLFVASYAAARNGQYKAARAQYDFSMRSLDNLLYGKMWSSISRFVNRLKNKFTS